MDQDETVPSPFDRARFDAWILDLDGVLTDTASLHRLAWKDVFDRLLQERASRSGEPFRPFDGEVDYRHHVDGKPRLDGIRAFLAARAIALPEGAPGDAPGTATVQALARLKNDRFNGLLNTQGVIPLAGAADLLEALRARGFGMAVSTSSKNCARVLDASGLANRFDAVVDGLVLEEIGAAGKPAPDGFLEAARRIGVAPARAVVVEDAEAGVAAGVAGGFGLVLGIDRAGVASALWSHGAQRVYDSVAVLAKEGSAP